MHSGSLRWSGTKKIRLQRIAKLDPDVEMSMTPAFLTDRKIEQAENLVRRAISEYITLQTGDRVDWHIKIHVPNKYAQSLQQKRNIVGVAGGAAPWTGEQQFVIRFKHGHTTIAVPFKTLVDLPPMVVVASRPIRRDEVLNAKALKYKSLSSSASEEQNYFYDISELVGQQMRRSLPTGQPVTQQSVGSPTVVKRGDIVALESVAGSIVVSTQAKSLGSGAVGELVEVELVSRERIFARVVESMRVRVSSASIRSNRPLR